MKRFLALALFLASSASATTAFAEGFLLGEETNGVTFTSDETDLNVRVRLQPRLDYGDIIKSKDGKSYETDKDLFFRRVRLELSGHLLAKTIRYSLILRGDKWDKAGNTNEVAVHYAYVEWEADEAFTLMVGKEKLPFSRVSLTSSAKRLLVENPVSTEAAKVFFGKTDAYYQPKIAAKGRFLEGVIAYEVAVADGWQNGEAVETARTVFKSNPLFVGRVELSPPGWVELKKSDAPLGKGQHLTLGADYADQHAIEYKENGFKENRNLWGVDLSGHYKGFTAQLEYNQWRLNSDDPAVSKIKPWGWYAQAGYFIDNINIEPVFRYEEYDQDSTGPKKKEKDTTLGVNWYARGHSLKVGANWVHTNYNTNASGHLNNAPDKDVFQLQGQLYF